MLCKEGICKTLTGLSAGTLANSAERGVGQGLHCLL